MKATRSAKPSQKRVLPFNKECSHARKKLLQKCSEDWKSILLVSDLYWRITAPADGAGTDCTALIALQLLTLGGRAAHERSEFNEVHGVKSKTKGEGSTYLSVQDLHIRYRKIKRRKKVSFYIWQDCYIAVSLCDCTLPKHVLPSSTTYIKMKRCPDMAPSYPRIVQGKSSAGSIHIVSLFLSDTIREDSARPRLPAQCE